jgi:hypothetical protein
LLSSQAYSIVYILAIDSYPSISPALIRFPESQFKGESALGFTRRFTTARHSDSRVHAGVQF